MTIHTQMRLALSLPERYEYGSWIRHDGVEQACDRLALWCSQGGSLWLRSQDPAGKTHLLRTVAHEYPLIALLDISATTVDKPALVLVDQWLKELEHSSQWMLDIAPGRMTEVVAQALFHLLERARDLQRPLIIAWRGDTHTLPPELSSRLLAVEQCLLAPPSNDDVLLNILSSSASSLQWNIRQQVLQAMLTYLPRQLDILIPALKELERLSFEQHIRPGPSWLKQQLTRIATTLGPRKE
ncbi:MAG: glucose-inhibited division protein A [Mariprofundus sp.]|nr:glucose-inhibited division protein A [Mariprofundus sp.]